MQSTPREAGCLYLAACPGKSMFQFLGTVGVTCGPEEIGCGHRLCAWEGRCVCQKTGSWATEAQEVPFED